ncbi:hypothetical protein H696_00743 [Fonticula alba]|uniref:Transcription factor CBF/NF-Y/archaeal histone domain-containing protein n=1 Tax=Fonticula alba TaxID=691883 RepID=A0A058ZFN3_FONAL|nr:hypothetical protein H696_00743 [Fonticula alba]KCV73200.1 hypothetical protein H696_00743 [Fonticula alba]|eukprot:XP_009492901.1 hypothetical protein H696_00743 [Fonticula alba]
MTAQRRCPRQGIKRVVKKAQPGLKLGANTDLLIYLNYIVFIRRLAAQAASEAQTSGLRKIDVDTLQNALEDL